MQKKSDVSFLVRYSSNLIALLLICSGGLLSGLSSEARAEVIPMLPEDAVPQATPLPPNPTPTLNPTPVGKQGCMTYQIRRGPGANSIYNSGTNDTRYYGDWMVWIGNLPDLQNHFRWGTAPVDFRMDSGYIYQGGAGAPSPVLTGAYDPCNRCRFYDDDGDPATPEVDGCQVCGQNNRPMPVTYEYPSGSGLVYRLMDTDFGSGGTCGSAECPCYLSGVVSPLVIDFRGSGLKYTDPGRHVQFNFGSGKVGTTWLANTESVAFIALPGADGAEVTSINQLFGDQTIGPDRKKSDNGFLALKKYDKNKDSVIDSKDAVFESLRLWFDLNGDGRSQKGELKTLPEKNIVSISLDYHEVVSQKDALGNLSRQSSEAKTDTNSTLNVYDVWFAPVSPLTTRESPSGQVAAMPLPGPKDPGYELLHSAWAKAVEAENFSQGEIPFGTGSIQTILDEKGNVTMKRAIFAHRHASCRVFVEMDAGDQVKKTYSLCH